MNLSTTLKIVSGGQTGADRAALDWAIKNGIPHGGWCPKGRLSEDGVISAQYQLTETPSKTITQRTDWNVRDSDGTVIFTVAPELGRGSTRTMNKAIEFGKPWLYLCQTEGVEKAGSLLAGFIMRYEIEVLNVAGSRASSEPGIAAWVSDVLDNAFHRLRTEGDRYRGGSKS